MGFAVRRAVPDDLAAISRVAVDSFGAGIPAGRKARDENLDTLIRDTVRELYESYVQGEEIEIIVAYERETEKVTGYIILALNNIDSQTGERQAFIQDMAIDREYWGKFIPQKLMDLASQIAREKGLKYLVGIVSRENRRALGTAIKALGFTVERYQVVKHLDSLID